MTAPTPDLPRVVGDFRFHTPDEEDDSIVARFRDLFGREPEQIIHCRHYTLAGPVPDVDGAVHDHARIHP